MWIEISGTSVQVEIIRNEMRQTQRGVEGNATIRMRDGRVIDLEGRWEDPYKCDDENPAVIDETIKVNGEVQPNGDENGVSIPDGEDGTCSGDIADELGNIKNRRPDAFW